MKTSLPSGLLAGPTPHFDRAFGPLLVAFAVTALTLLGHMAQ